MTINIVAVSALWERRTMRQRLLPGGLLEVIEFSPGVHFVQLLPSRGRCARFRPNHPTMIVLSEAVFRPTSLVLLAYRFLEQIPKLRVCSIRKNSDQNPAQPQDGKAANSDGETEPDETRGSELGRSHSDAPFKSWGGSSLTFSDGARSNGHAQSVQ